MDRTPDTSPALAAVAELLSQMRAGLDRTLTHDEGQELVADMYRLSTMALWGREAAMQIATHADPKVTFMEMSRATGAKVSTIHNRLQGWRASNGGG